MPRRSRADERRRSDGVLAPPDDFIPTAERSGLIAELDRWVLHRSLEQLGRWRRGPAVHIAGLRTLGVGTSVDDFGVARSTEEQLEATHGRAAAATSA